MPRRVARFNTDSYSKEAEKCLIKCLKVLYDEVDSQLYRQSPWVLWEMFGACYHALRINSLLIFGKDRVKISTLFPGALTNIADLEVQLTPTVIVRVKENYSSTLNNIVSSVSNTKEKHDWIKTGVVV